MRVGYPHSWAYAKSQPGPARTLAGTKKARSVRNELLKNKPGDTYFRGFTTIIGSKRLAFVFGMGTRVSTWIWSPEKRSTASPLLNVT